MKRFVWFQSLGKLGKEAIDLYSCRKFVASKFNFEDDSDTEIYFLTPTDRWIRYRKYIDPFYNSGQARLIKDVRECTPEEVAHALLRYGTFGDKLPEVLKDYYRYGDFHVYAEWMFYKHDEIYFGNVASDQKRPKWDGVCLMYENKLCKKFARRATNQAKILEEFEPFHWISEIKSPFKSETQLKQTVKDMNNWENSHIVFGQRFRGVCWKPKPS